MIIMTKYRIHELAVIRQKEESAAVRNVDEVVALVG